MHNTLRLLPLLALGAAACGAELPPLTPPPADSVPPAVVALAPAPGDTGVAPKTTIRVTFSEPLNWATVGVASLFVVGPQDTVPGGFSFVDATASFRPVADLDSLTRYAVHLTRGVRDSAGNPLVRDTSWSFTTGRPPVPVASRSPRS